MANSAERLAEPMTGDAFLRWMETWRDVEKWELHEGYPVAMAGGTAVHDTIAINLTSALLPARKKGCRPHRDILLRSPENDGFGAFPDVYVRCGPTTDRKTWLDDPVAIFEVLSASTWRMDQGYKREQYLQFATLQHYVVVYQSELRAEVWSRDGENNWPGEPEVLNGIEKTLHLSAFDLDIPMTEIYADTELAANAGAGISAAQG